MARSVVGRRQCPLWVLQSGYGLVGTKRQILSTRLTIVIARKPRPRDEPPRKHIPHSKIVRPVVKPIDHEELARRAAAAEEVWRELVRRTEASKAD
jgi:hypothetical protein